MKVYAHHDEEGNIHAIVTTNAPKEGGLMLTPNPGHFVAEVEGIKAKGDSSDFDALREIASTHKLSTPLSRYTVIKKK